MAFRKGDFWIVDDVVAYVEKGAVTLRIGAPDRALPKNLSYNVADKIWYAGQMRELEIARQQGETKEIPLTDRKRRSSLRLGGGFMITQGTKLLLARRSFTANRRPGQFCEFGGVFEVVNPKDKDDISNDFIASLLRESLEIAIKKGSRIYVPQLSAITNNITPDTPEVNVYFQPPDISLEDYNTVIREELLEECERARIPNYDSGEVASFYMKILDYERSVKLHFGYSPEISVEITAEVDTSSLECVGVLSFPENIDLAAITYLEEMATSGAEELDDDAQKTLAQLKKETLQDTDLDNPNSEHEFWDTECITEVSEIIQEEICHKTPDYPFASKTLRAYLNDKSNTNPEQWCFPLDREVHFIDYMNRNDTIWMLDPEFSEWNCPSKRRRVKKESTVGRELSTIRLRATGGNFATEKLSLAIKMHCPLPQLEPLITL
jgi:hypothetical protein